MRSSASTYVTLGGLCCLTVAVWFCGQELVRLNTSLEPLLRPKEPSDVQTLTEQVTRPSGRVVTVTTTRADGESEADFIRRHDATVALLQQNG